MKKFELEGECIRTGCNPEGSADPAFTELDFSAKDAHVTPVLEIAYPSGTRVLPAVRSKLDQNLTLKMLSLSSGCRYFLYQQPCDMRCGIYSLAGLVANSLQQNPLSGRRCGGDIFIFIGKRGNQIRLLQWDKDGYAMYIKRLEAGTFEWPASGKLQLSAQELMLILSGIRLTAHIRANEKALRSTCST